MERRAAPRRGLVRPVRVGTASEAPLPTARLMDASTHGLLLSFPEPVGLPTGLRVCVSVPDPSGALHLVGRVARVERGDDFHTYVGIALGASVGAAVDPADPADPADAGRSAGMPARRSGVGDDVTRWADWLAAAEREPHDTCRSR